jgi:hypothetical protein
MLGSGRTYNPLNKAHESSYKAQSKGGKDRETVYARLPIDIQHVVLAPLKAKANRLRAKGQESSTASATRLDTIVRAVSKISNGIKSNEDMVEATQKIADLINPANPENVKCLAPSDSSSFRAVAAGRIPFVKSSDSLETLDTIYKLDSAVFSS